VLAEGLEDGVWAGRQVGEESAEGLANGADLALFIAFGAAHVFSGPVVDGVQFGAGFFALDWIGVWVVDGGQASAS